MNDRMPWLTWPKERWEAYRAALVAYAKTDPAHKPTQAGIRLADRHIEQTAP